MYFHPKDNYELIFPIFAEDFSKIKEVRPNSSTIQQNFRGQCPRLFSCHPDQAVSCTAEKGEPFPEHSAAAAATPLSRAQASMGKGRETLVACRHQSSLLQE